MLKRSCGNERESGEGGEEVRRRDGLRMKQGQRKGEMIGSDEDGEAKAEER